eukprot:1218688-Pyramimonas_sp.AAC.1
MMRWLSAPRGRAAGEHHQARAADMFVIMMCWLSVPRGGAAGEHHQARAGAEARAADQRGQEDPVAEVQGEGDAAAAHPALRPRGPLLRRQARP